ncbi:hypothetical protein QQS21_003279 [Conoideocrella luteorostrata]|uniref:Enoyl reductase (ER) domain-containing protein n=1 Tax=Conoideocrella luteorostrata TaxID=1105319 RepID=A0AAJ0FWJ4_9HYPO|nr:hypothetical protein QQS21_003279 [Conoideocrella luteorostrata]
MALSSYIPGFLWGGSGGKKPSIMAPEKMKQWTTGLDGVDKLQLSEVDVPAPVDGEVLVQIHAVGLNSRDNEVCSGQVDHSSASIQQKQRIVPCSDMCGTVIDSKSKLLKPGTRVMSIFLQTHLEGPIKEEDLASGLGLPLPGVLTQYRVFPACSLVQVPEYLTDEEASCLPISAVTAWSSLNWMRPIGQHIGTQAGNAFKFVLLQGTGGVAVAGLQTAHAAGYKTIITSSSDDKLKRAADELKADHGINYKTYWEWQEPVMKATDGRGVDIIFETGGTRTLRKSFDSVAFGGVINCIGSLSGKSDDPGEGNGGDKTPQLHRLNVNVLALRRSVTLRGIINGGKDRFEEMLGFYREKQIRPVVSKVFGFDQAKDALGYLADGKNLGKVVIKVKE